MRAYIDVDGVINANNPQGWGRLQNGHAAGYKIRWAPAMVEALAALPVEHVWATTWQEEAVTAIAPLIGAGNHWPVLNPVSVPHPLDWSIVWKFEAVRSEQNQDARFIWIDDEIADEHVAFFPNALVLRSRETTGISVAQIEAMQKYIAAEDN